MIVPNAHCVVLLCFFITRLISSRHGRGRQLSYVKDSDSISTFIVTLRLLLFLMRVSLQVAACSLKIRTH